MYDICSGINTLRLTNNYNLKNYSAQFYSFLYPILHCTINLIEKSPLTVAV